MLKHPFVSIVVISHNGEGTLGITLDSLMHQTYPPKNYEVILVNDASTDSTEQVAKSYPRVVYVGLKKNQGISGARNAGLKAAKGEIYVAFDDDCVAEPTWLRELVKGYASGNPAGVGGRLCDPHEGKGIVGQYISASDSNLAPQLAGAGAGSKNPVRRFWRYLSCRAKEYIPSDQKAEVTELYGANGSYVKDILNKVGGWRKTMSGIEDRDLSQRIREAYPNRPFYSMPKAVIMHDRGQTLLQYLLRPYKRGPLNLAFHRENHITPPVFPFPFLFIAGVVAAGLLHPLVAIPAALFVPQLLYFWWPIKAVRHHRLVMILFPYLQLAEESMVVIGLARGYILLARGVVGRALRPFIGVLHFLVIMALILAWSSVTLYSSLTWLRTVVSVPFLLLIPGYCVWLLIVGKVQPKQRGFGMLGYIVGLSLLVLMVSGLLLNEAYNFFDLAHPFVTSSLTYMIGGVTGLLALLAFIRSPRTFRLISPSLLARKVRLVPLSAAVLMGLSLPLLSVAGAMTLNNGGSNGLALVVMGAGIALLLLLALGGRGLRPYYAWFLYSICLSILLGTSMRGWNITGHDVMQEYQVFQLTLKHAAWHMQYYQDAYMACLSITILPTIMQKLTGLSDPYVYKFVFQLFFALVAPVMYGTLQSYTTKRRALLATILFISFPTFLTDIMMLNRQETALLFLALSLQAGLDKQLNQYCKSLLGFLLLIGMVLSHYSTSYVALGGLGVALCIALLWRGVSRLLRRRSAQTLSQLTSIYHAPVIIAALLVLTAWGTFATQTSNNMYHTLQTIVTTVQSQLKGTMPARIVAPPATVAQYSADAVKSRTLSVNDYYPTAQVSNFSLQSASGTLVSPSNLIARWGVTANMLTMIYNLLRSVYALAVEGLIALGLLLVFLRKRHYNLPVQYMFIGVGVLALIATQVILPPPVIDYGLTRVIQQGLLVLSLPMVLASLWVIGLVRLRQGTGERVLAVILAGFLLVLSGFLSTLTGGFKPVLPLSNSGFYYEAYYTHQEEITAAHWLDVSTPVGSRVYSDEFMRRKIITYAGIFAQPTLVPGAIPIDSYVFLDYGNMTFQRVPAYDGSGLIYYQTPTKFLNANKNLIYSSTNVAIYK